MPYIFHLIITVICGILAYVFSSIYCLFNPRSPKHVATFGHMSGRLAPPFGLKVECHRPAGVEDYGNAICIASHQNNYDMVTASNIVQPPTVTVDKEGLLWVPFFGQLYWLTDDLLIDRNSRTKARGTIAEIVNRFKRRHISIWMFPEGTRSHGHSPLPLRTGAFHTAIAAGVPIIPVYASTASSEINLNRLHNGLVIVEVLPPIDASQYGRGRARELAAHCCSIVEQEITELGKEITKRETTGKV